MKIWICSMECSGIAEAGGVKNVTFSLCKEFSLLQNDVVLFIPRFKCTSLSKIYDFQEKIDSVEINLCNKTEKVFYSIGKSIDGKFNVVFVEHKVFSSKEGVYTYTKNEEKKNPLHKKGTGHTDSLFIDSLFSAAVAAYSQKISKEKLPDIIHCQDASCATIPLYVSKYDCLNNAKTFVTIHNAGPAYHHNFENIEQAVFYTGFSEDKFMDCLNDGKPEPFLIAHKFGATLTTVSESYGTELTDVSFFNETEGLSAQFAEKKIVIKGITNGIDLSLYDPRDSSKSFLPFEFEPEALNLDGKYLCRKFFLEKTLSRKAADFLEGISLHGFLSNSENLDEEIYFSYHGRITSQKGLGVLLESVPKILEKIPNARFVITGQGEQELEKSLINLSEHFAGKLIFLNGYNKTGVRLAVAACDFILLPSFFEPCGLEDFIAQVYGTIPIAHATGGLKKIIDGQTGFLYSENTSESFCQRIFEATDLFKNDRHKFMEMISFAAKNIRENYQWKDVVQNKYIPLLTMK